MPDDTDAVSAFSPGWGLTADEIEANRADWRNDMEELQFTGSWPTSEEIAEYEAEMRRRHQGRSR